MAVRRREKIGTREAPGAANNPAIMGWAKRLGAKALGVVYNADSMPWCGLFVTACMNETQLAPPPIAVREGLGGVGRGAAAVGARARPVLVFERPGGGHIGLYVGEDATHFHVLGGNQGDRVSIMRLE